MRYLILSDSHGSEEHISLLDKELDSVDAVIHLGDHAEDIHYLSQNPNLIFYVIRGNCDSKDFGKSEILIEDHGKKVLMTHGHRYNVKINLMNLCYKGEEIGADIVLFGHTHFPMTEDLNGMWLHNPGSLTFPMPGSARGYSIMKIDESGVEIVRHELLE
ncbi:MULTISPECIES: YfcE family phosphodiesterase [unclassified Fusibacter]|uniref:YfcE family phosphodiesterase n=1 Tax=unclassified Fusibacter TaxID=2624464 RepID=UPI0010128DBB|nr:MULTISPECIES: metallophosphoesterase [unclassified Fusibacter]MCK8060795.1 metallophosphoesterase [Fusibacter sp. A2]NPE23091.1 metallophosphoesterase [Fusibacter sp. A1]RXV59761.1 metallophosphoesterase [Fusibacter sp. A1]